MDALLTIEIEEGIALLAINRAETRQPTRTGS